MSIFCNPHKYKFIFKQGTHKQVGSLLLSTCDSEDYEFLTNEGGWPHLLTSSDTIGVLVKLSLGEFIYLELHDE